MTSATPIKIDLTPTWPETAQVLLALLQNGTAEGKQLARKELLRMAEIAERTRTGAESVTLYEVMTMDPQSGYPLGQTFNTKAHADAYARDMRAAGFEVDPSPPYETRASAEEARAIAIDHFAGSKR